MPRRVARSSRSSNAPGGGAVTVVAGSIRTADDSTALDVKISIWDTEVTMRADGAELGHWPAPSVSITPIDAFTFEFVAEGDHLVFTPNNPDEFNQHPMVSGASRSKRKRRDKKADTTPALAELRWDEETPTEVDKRSRRTKATKKEEPRESRKDRKAAVRAAKDSSAAAAAMRANQAPLVDYDTPRAPKLSRQERRNARRPEPVAEAVIDAPAQPKPQKLPKQPKEPKQRKAPAPQEPSRKERKPKSDTNGHSRFAELRHRRWMSSLDFARQYDIFGLDRVPVHLEQRDDPDHAHTWSHRVAPASGPSSFICTLCGAFKRRNS